ncbi:MAG: PAS domain S-box protein [Gemmatimonadota bacterium]|nr:PAS domain S-box protein [Gemmatimonadota bacterium]MDH5759248.1 PAS domain S-box protein [Gemmatimonadota bacterium]
MLTADEYRVIFEASPDGIVVVDDEGLIRDVNPQMESIFGWAREELLGESVEMLIPTVFRTAHSEHRRRYLRNPHMRPMGVGMELRALRKDGQEIPVEIALSPGPPDEDCCVICSVRDVSDRKRLRDFSSGALNAIEEERQRIARELHDDTAQRLATLMLRLRFLVLEEDPEVRIEKAEAFREEILDAAEGVKRIARGLRPPELEDVGLLLALTAHLRSVREASGLRVSEDFGSVEGLLDLDGKLAVYRVVQEAVSNVVRHSGASEASVTVTAEGPTVVAIVTDNGRGFTQAMVDGGGGGLGLVGMQERALMLGGHVTIDSVPGQGTSVRVELPTKAAEAQNV